MSTETATKAGKTVDAAVNQAAKAASVSAAAVSEALPTVVETMDVVTTMTMPAKIVLNQKLVVAVSVVGGAALGAGILFGVNKWRNRNKVVVPDSPEGVDDFAGV